MDTTETGYRTEPCPDCQRPVIRAAAGRGRPSLVDPQPDDAGEIQLRPGFDGLTVLAYKLTVAQQFGRQGRLHVLHSKTCAKKRGRTRARSS